jgi:RNA polymerase sigma-70 factor (ECF subfamily)
MDSFGDRVARELPRLRRYGRALTRDVAAADDLVQESVARALAKQHLWQEGTNLRAWLFTILHNQHVTQVRRRIREVKVLAEIEWFADDIPRQPEMLQMRDMARALDTLPASVRSAILLVAIEGLRYEDVAQIQGVPVGTVRSRLSRGRASLWSLTGGGAEHPAALKPRLSGPVLERRLATG